MSERGKAPGRVGQHIRARVLVLIAAGMLMPIAVMAWAGWRSYSELQRRAMAERELMARLVSERLDRTLSYDLEALQAAVTGFSVDTPRPEQARALRAVYLRHHERFDDVFFIDRTGRVLVHEPQGRPTLDASGLLGEAFRAGRPWFTRLMTDANGRHRVFALVPIRSRGEVTSVVGATIDPSKRGFATLLKVATEEAGTVDVVDEQGVILASTVPQDTYGRASQADRVLAFLAQPLSARGNGCTAWQAERAERHGAIYAFCALNIARWGVKAHQPRGAAFAFIESLIRNVAALGAILFAVAMLFALGASWSVTRPVASLTRAAERLTGGELDVPIPALPDDEVGRLGVSLERMRIALKESLERVARAKDELENRVAERTAELVVANAALHEREEQRREALRKVITAQEDERKRIARELHDETTQALAALVMKLQLAETKIRDESKRQLISEARLLAVAAVDEVHRMIVDLRPSVLDDLGLHSAIVWYADRILKPRGVSVRFEFSGLEERLPPEVETTLFRCAQEALSNVARHAAADAVLVECNRREDGVVLEIEDDGKGFDPAARRGPDERGHGFGLLGMRERIELIGGTVQLSSSPGRGTHLKFFAPLFQTVPGPERSGKAAA